MGDDEGRLVGGEYRKRMNRLTEEDGKGNWRLKGVNWEQLNEGTEITRETAQRYIWHWTN